MPLTDRETHQIAARLPDVVRALGVDDWRVNVNFDEPAEGDDTAMEIARDVAYRKATLYLGAPAEDEAEALRFVRHEAIHLLLSDLDVFLGVVRGLVGHGRARDALEETWRVTHEQAVHRIERALDAVGASPESLASSSPPSPPSAP